MVSEVFYHHQLLWPTKEADIGLHNLKTIDTVSLALRHLHFREMMTLQILPLIAMLVSSSLSSGFTLEKKMVVF